MMQTTEPPRFDGNPALMNLDAADDKAPLKQANNFFSPYFQRVFSNLARTLNSLISSRNTGVTGLIATGTAINHGMTPPLPQFVTLVPQDAVPTNYYADTITATQFTIHYTGGGTHKFGWSAET